MRTETLAISETLTLVLSVLAALATTGFVCFLGLYIYNELIERFLLEVKEEPGGGAKGIGPVTIRRLGALNRRLMWPGYEMRMRRKLIKAGEPSGYRPEDILAMQELFGVFAFVLGIFAVLMLEASFFWAIVLGAFGAAYPLIWVNDQITKRHLQISRALPYSLDLLTLSVEAGLDFPAGLAKVVEKGRPGPLRDELQLVLKQLKMGKKREEALKSMIARVDLPPLTSFVTALIQADKMGTSLGKVLRIQSTQMRIDRTQRAEKLASEAPVKMLFPLIGCIFPTVFMIIFGPLVYAFMFGNVV